MFYFNRQRLYEEDSVNRIQMKLDFYGLGFVHTETAWYLNCLSPMMYAVSLKTNPKKSLKKKKHCFCFVLVFLP